jgi:hypothetical protein
MLLSTADASKEMAALQAVEICHLCSESAGGVGAGTAGYTDFAVHVGDHI